jgi:hypothetical protein
MLDRTHRIYRTSFVIGAPARLVNRALREPEPWLAQLSNVVALERIAAGDEHGVGARYHVQVRAIAPYVLRWDMEVIEHSSTRTRWSASGDLEGEGRWELHALGDRTALDSTWAVHPTVAWIVALWPLARPLLVANHDAVMRRGVGHLAAHLDAELVAYQRHPPIADRPRRRLSRARKDHYAVGP